MMIWGAVLAAGTLSGDPERGLGRHLLRMAWRWTVWLLWAAVLTALLLPAVSPCREAGHASVLNNLHNIAEAFRAYYVVTVAIRRLT